jgi:hypothetical protein
MGFNTDIFSEVTKQLELNKKLSTESECRTYITAANAFLTKHSDKVFVTTKEEIKDSIAEDTEEAVKSSYFDAVKRNLAQAHRKLAEFLLSKQDKTSKDTIEITKGVTPLHQEIKEHYLFALQSKNLLPAEEVLMIMRSLSALFYAEGDEKTSCNYLSEFLQYAHEKKVTFFSTGRQSLLDVATLKTAVPMCLRASNAATAARLVNLWDNALSGSGGVEVLFWKIATQAAKLYPKDRNAKYLYFLYEAENAGILGTKVAPGCYASISLPSLEGTSGYVELKDFCIPESSGAWPFSGASASAISVDPVVVKLQHHGADVCFFGGNNATNSSPINDTVLSEEQFGKVNDLAVEKVYDVLPALQHGVSRGIANTVEYGMTKAGYSFWYSVFGAQISYAALSFISNYVKECSESDNPNMTRIISNTVYDAGISLTFRMFNYALACGSNFMQQKGHKKTSAVIRSAQLATSAGFYATAASSSSGKAVNMVVGLGSEIAVTEIGREVINRLS